MTTSITRPHRSPLSHISLEDFVEFEASIDSKDIPPDNDRGDVCGACWDESGSYLPPASVIFPSLVVTVGSLTAAVYVASLPVGESDCVAKANASD